MSPPDRSRTAEDDDEDAWVWERLRSRVDGEGDAERSSMEAQGEPTVRYRSGFQPARYQSEAASDDAQQTAASEAEPRVEVDPFRVYALATQRSEQARHAARSGQADAAPVAEPAPDSNAAEPSPAAASTRVEAKREPPPLPQGEPANRATVEPAGQAAPGAREPRVREPSGAVAAVAARPPPAPPVHELTAQKASAPAVRAPWAARTAGVLAGLLLLGFGQRELGKLRRQNEQLVAALSELQRAQRSLSEAHQAAQQAHAQALAELEARLLRSGRETTPAAPVPAPVPAPVVDAANSQVEPHVPASKPAVVAAPQKPRKPASVVARPAVKPAKPAAAKPKLAKPGKPGTSR